MRKFKRDGSAGLNMLKRLLAAAVGVLLAGCSAVDTVDFYWQGAAGQMDLLARARPIPEVIEGGDRALALRLGRVREIRSFASRQLGLPDNGSYTRYTELGRQFVLWNVFAAPALSLKPLQWCFLGERMTGQYGDRDEHKGQSAHRLLTSCSSDPVTG